MLLVILIMFFLVPSPFELWLLSKHMVLRPCSSVRLEDVLLLTSMFSENEIVFEQVLKVLQAIKKIDY
jgi:hypothetical protein